MVFDCVLPTSFPVLPFRRRGRWHSSIIYRFFHGNLFTVTPYQFHKSSIPILSSHRLKKGRQGQGPSTKTLLQICFLHSSIQTLKITFFILVPGFRCNLGGSSFIAVHILFQASSLQAPFRFSLIAWIQLISPCSLDYLDMQ